jgi:hypothetical protein
MARDAVRCGQGEDVFQVDKANVANRPVDSGYRLDFDNGNVENRRKALFLGPRFDNVSVRHHASAGMVQWDGRCARCNRMLV